MTFKAGARRIGLGLGSSDPPRPARSQGQGHGPRQAHAEQIGRPSFFKAAPPTSNSSIPKCPPLRSTAASTGRFHHHSGAHFRFHLSQIGQDDGQAHRHSFIPVQKRRSHLFESHQRRQSDESRDECGRPGVGGAFDKRSGMPNNCLGPARSHRREPQAREQFRNRGPLPGLTDPGTLGSTYSAFNPAGGGTAKENMELRIAPDRLADRQGLLGGLDGIKRNLDADGLLEGADYFCQQAFDRQTKGISSAFDVTQEDPKTLAKYDTRPLSTPASSSAGVTCARVTNLLGLQMLMARRLCESGVPSSPFRIADGITTPTTTAPKAWPDSTQWAGRSTMRWPLSYRICMTADSMRTPSS